MVLVLVLVLEVLMLVLLLLLTLMPWLFKGPFSSRFARPTSLRYGRCRSCVRYEGEGDSLLFVSLEGAVMSGSCLCQQSEKNKPSLCLTFWQCSVFCSPLSITWRGGGVGSWASGRYS